MKKLLLLLILTSYTSFSQVDIGEPSNYMSCSNTGFDTFDLTTSNGYLFITISNSDLYTVNFYTSLSDAQNNVNPIVNPQQYTNTVSGFQTIYVRVTEIANPENFATEDFDLIISGFPLAAPLQDVELCPGFTNGSNGGVILDTGLTSPEYGFTWLFNGYPIPGAPSYGTYTATMPGEYSVDIYNEYCLTTDTVVVSESSLPPASVSVVVTGNTITVNVIGTGNYTYTLDMGGIIQQESNIFTDLNDGMYVIYVTDDCGSMYGTAVNISMDFEIPAPEGQAVQTFEPGATLADIELEGENILWYDNAGSNDSEVSPLNNDEPLPLSTVLVNGTTYYASQTINGIESQQRFAVTVNVALSTGNHDFTALQYYPNPATDYITFTYNAAINSIEVYNQLGQKVIDSNYNSNTAKTNISALANGIYMVKVKSGNSEKTVKVIKH